MGWIIKEAYLSNLWMVSDWLLIWQQISLLLLKENCTRISIDCFSPPPLPLKIIAYESGFSFGKYNSFLARENILQFTATFNSGMHSGLLIIFLSFNFVESADIWIHHLPSFKMKGFSASLTRFELLTSEEVSNFLSETSLTFTTIFSNFQKSGISIWTQTLVHDSCPFLLINVIADSF